MFQNLKVYYQITVTDTKTGKVIRKTKKKRSRSFVKQFLQLLEVTLNHPLNTSGDASNVTDTGNTSRSVQVSTQNLNSVWTGDGQEDGDTYGLVVGTDSTAEANTDYKLNALISDGSGSGELDYGEHTWVNTAVVGANVDFQVQRPFINNSGGNVTIEECGYYIQWVSWFFCIIRDVTGSVVVADGQTATVDYTFRTTV